METRAQRGSLPPVVGWIALAIGLAFLGDCVFTAPSDGSQIVLGLRATGVVGWIATLAHAFFFLWLAYASLRRRSIAAWAAIGFSVYLIECLWVYSLGEGAELLRGVRSMLLVNALVTGVLLTLCRVILARRGEFDA